MIIFCCGVSMQCYGQDVPDETNEATDSINCSQCIRCSRWVRFVVDAAAGSVINFGVTTLLKDNIHEWRPNHKDLHSFPSRHATLAWGWGSRVGYRMTWRSRWWAPSMHLVASAISQQRIMAREHYAGDVLAGTILGLGSAGFSGWMSNLICGKLRVYPERHSLHPSDELSVLVSTYSLMSLGWNNTKSMRQVRSCMAGYGTYITANIPITEHWSINAIGGLSSYQLTEADTHEYLCPVNAMDWMAGATVSSIVGPKPVECYATMAAGWRHYFCKLPSATSLTNSTSSSITDSNITNGNVHDGYSRNSFIAHISGGLNIYFLDKLAIGPGFAISTYSFTPYRCNSNRLGTLELAFTLNTRLHF